eukprot:scaffold14378_cov187-Ochromonas_danica.AAC.4
MGMIWSALRPVGVAQHANIPPFNILAAGVEEPLTRLGDRIPISSTLSYWSLLFASSSADTSITSISFNRAGSFSYAVLKMASTKAGSLITLMVVECPRSDRSN